ncbi:protein ELC-like [Juglans microcarpa x Juglans regia]|uniref:protein ELC-like n=1 Tax=Juglans microcarpa x Juglans regia TaxID=2249226 RepID=UPI001B7E59B7|nr:protein ELC-like [Juglans microcarpa x Juglans regia]
MLFDTVSKPLFSQLLTRVREFLSRKDFVPFPKRILEGRPTQRQHFNTKAAKQRKARETIGMVPPAVQAGPSPANPQQTQQFLSSVLSQRGPSALPYSEDTKWLIRQHLLSLSSSCPSLEPKTATFTHNDGRSIHLLQAEGTVPMSFQGLTYNIPVILWLMESYPRHPPCVYVNPTRDMVIKRPHPYVNPSGLVSVPYLQNWVYPSSNLVDLVRSLSLYFGRDPPLYSQRRPNANSNPNPNPNPNPNLNPSFTPPSPHPPDVTASSLGYARPSIQTRPYPPSPYGVQTEEPSEAYRRSAVNKLVELVHGDMTTMRKAREAEMEGLFNAQAMLWHREEQLKKGLNEMHDEKEGLEQQLQMMLMNTDMLEAWLRENEAKLRNLRPNVDVDDAFEIIDVPSKQMLECAASDLAIEDVVYSLDKAVQEGAIPFDQYLRNVRLLSREQFFHRATATKMRAAHMQAQVAHMAARISHFGGDTEALRARAS